MLDKQKPNIAIVVSNLEIPNFHQHYILNNKISPDQSILFLLYRLFQKYY
nr:MAG TPA: hypothetical protein [Caudoviricetes sp.]